MTRPNVSLIISILLLPFAGAAAPVLETTRPAAPAHPGVPMAMEFTVQWEGAPDAWIVLAPDVPPVSWAEVRPFEAEVSHHDGKTVVVQVLEVTPKEEGAFELPEIVIPYMSGARVADDGVVQIGTRLEPDTSTVLRSERIPIEVTQERHGEADWAITGSSLALILALVLFALWMRTRRQPESERELPGFDEAQDALHTARRHRLDGDFYAYYKELVRVAEFVCQHGNGTAEGDPQALRDTLKRRAQDTGYRGVRPTDDELDGDFREIERAMARCKEDQVS